MPVPVRGAGVVFAEYVGEFPLAGSVTHVFNSGGGFRITPAEQIDFHAAIGLNHNAPAYVLGVGYSFRIGGLLKAK
jgi:hypothetical protein